MNAIMTISKDVATANLISEFVGYIDRSEKTTRTYLNNLKQFVSWLDHNDIHQPNRNTIISYRDYLSQEHKPNTVKQYLQSVKQFFSWTASNGYYPNIAENIHAPKVSAATHKKEALAPTDVVAIENSINEKMAHRVAEASQAAKDTSGRVLRATEQNKRLEAMFLLAVNAGLRTIEIHRANVKDIELKGGQAYIYIWGKGHAEADQKKPIAIEVYNAVQEYLEMRGNVKADQPLFTATGNRNKGGRIATTTISTMLKRAMVEAGYNSERITAHSLRHTAAQGVINVTDKNIYMAQKYLRHANPTTTEIYLRETAEELNQQAEIAANLYSYYHQASN